jgi:hypothetical protein
MAEATGLQTKVTSRAISSGVSKRLINELGRTLLKNSFSMASNDPGEISAAEAYPTEHIDLEDVAPILVGELIERLGLINSEVVDQNVHRRKTFEQAFRCHSCGQVSGKSLDVCLVHRLTNLFQRETNGVIRTSVHDDTSTFRGKLASNGETDALGGTGNSRYFSRIRLLNSTGLVSISRRTKREK